MCIHLVTSDNPQDDPASMDFVTSAANIRAHIFSITMKSRFDVKGLFEKFFFSRILCVNLLKKVNLLQKVSKIIWVLNYTRLFTVFYFSLFYLFVERGDRIVRKLDASTKDIKT